MILNVEDGVVSVMIQCNVRVVGNATSFVDRFNSSSNRGQASEKGNCESFHGPGFIDAAAILRLSTKVEAMACYAGGGHEETSVASV